MPHPRRPLTADERLDWLRLWRSENVGPRTFRDLVRATGSAGAALDRLPELARRGGLRRPIRVCPAETAAREAEALAALGGRLIAFCETDYPAPLAAIADPPPLLGVLGNPHLLAREAVAVVGARNASGIGRRLARGLAAELGPAGLVVVSGLARGIDAEAHLGGLETGTVAVVAGGVDVVYPPENEALRQRIVESGAIVSEQPLGMEPQGRHFPRRNRIISGLALGTLVVEAGLRSGSLITARLAAEQGREVFAVPGSPLDPRYRGTNALLRDGATFTETADDVLDGLAPMRRKDLAEPVREPVGEPVDGVRVVPPEPTDQQREAVLATLGPSPLGVDELVRQCHLTPAEVMVMVLELELAGRIVRHSGGMVSLG
jgi:DNA processing protein